MNPLNKTQAIIIGLLALVLALILGTVLIDIHDNTQRRKANEEQYARENATPAMAVEPVFDVNTECPTYQADSSAGKYENIPGACFEYFHITDAALESRLRSLTPYENPCSN